MKSLIVLIFICLSSFGFLEDNSQKKILYFGASWCPPCVNFKMNELPKLDDIYDKIELYDIDQHKDSYKRYKKNSKTIPLFIFIDDDGNEYQRLSGYQSASTLLKIWNSN